MSIRYPADVLATRLCRARGVGFRPRMVVVNLTHRCNCRCEVCTLTRDWRIGREPELGLEGYRKLFASPLLRGADLIRFTGGEPFLKPELTEIVCAARDLAAPRNLYLITNASFPRELEELVRAVAAPGVDLQVQISLDSDLEAHESYRGLPGLAARVIDAFERLARLRDSHRIGVGVNQTLFSMDPEPVVTVNEIVNRYGIAHNFSTAVRYHESRMDIPPCMSEFPFEPCFEWDAEGMRALFDTIDKHVFAPMKGRKAPPTERLRNMVTRYLIANEKNYFLAGGEFPRLPCVALFAALRLDPYGGIIPCAVRKADVVGNIGEEEFHEVWTGLRARRMREIVKQCRCWVECEVITNAIYSGAILPWLARNLG